jgi:hypothetical protein
MLTNKEPFPSTWFNKRTPFSLTKPIPNSFLNKSAEEILLCVLISSKLIIAGSMHGEEKETS